MSGEWRTDKGKIRSLNEDAVYFNDQLGPLTLAIVADGMGGHQGGDVASKLAIEIILQQLQDLITAAVSPKDPVGSDDKAADDTASQVLVALTEDEARQRLQAAIVQANQEIYRRAMADESLVGMGTTVVVALLSRDWGCIAHVGDSRAYAFREGRLLPLTQDHSLVNELLKSGQISAEEAVHHPQRNVLMRAVGTNPEVEVELNSYRPVPEDWLLLCSDGLTSTLTETQISQILSEPGTLWEKAECLLQTALDQGGEDNISFIFCSPPSFASEGHAG